MHRDGSRHGQAGRQGGRQALQVPISLSYYYGRALRAVLTFALREGKVAVNSRRHLQACLFCAFPYMLSVFLGVQDSQCITFTVSKELPLLLFMRKIA